MKLTVRDAARLLRISETDLYRMVDDGAIPCHHVNRQPMFSHAELVEWATERRRPISADEVVDEDAAAVDLAAALEVGGIHRDVPGDDRESVLRAIVDRLLPDEGDREMVLAILLARETEASTGVGNGIAIPHVRGPLVFAGQPAAVALCYLAQPVPFAAIDGLPVHTVFAMVTPTIHAHLDLLSRLATALLDPGFADTVARRASRDEIIGEARRVQALRPRTVPSG